MRTACLVLAVAGCWMSLAGVLALGWLVTHHAPEPRFRPLVGMLLGIVAVGYALSIVCGDRILQDDHEEQQRGRDD